MSDVVTYDRGERVATITLDDGKANALSGTTLQALHDALDQAERDEAIVLLRGREGTLSAGFDLKTFTEGGDAVLHMLRLGARLVERLLGFPTPVVVASTGHAVAAGSFLLLAADVRLATRGAFRIGLNEVRIGLTVPRFVIALAQYRLTAPAADRALMTGSFFDPDAARAAGFVDEVVEASGLLGRAQEVAADLATLSAEAHRATKLRAGAATIEAVRTTAEQEFGALA